MYLLFKHKKNNKKINFNTYYYGKNKIQLAEKLGLKSRNLNTNQVLYKRYSLRALGNGNFDTDAALIFFSIISLHALCNEFTINNKHTINNNVTIDGIKCYYIYLYICKVMQQRIGKWVLHNCLQ